MNKTININLGGFFFHIDEVAYQTLKRYLASISKSLSDDPQGKDEIIADIEARISELLSEKITDARQVVNESDIENIIVIMGQPEDYAENEENYSNSEYNFKKNSTTGKKLFRDGDDKFLGGVAAGIAHYVNIDTIWVRLTLLALFFGGGFGFIIYIILWILLPEAKTTAEKLQMEGEPVNIDNIEKKIREEFNNVSENVSEFASKASEKIKDSAQDLSEKMNATFSGKGSKNNGLQDFIDTIARIFLVFFKVIGKIIGVFFIFLGATVILSLLIGGFSIGSLEWFNINGEFLTYPPFFYEATIPKWILTILMFFLVGIPFLILLVLGLRILSSNVKKFTKATSLTLLGIWIIALLGIIFTGIEHGVTHAKEGRNVITETINLTQKDTLFIAMKNNNNLYYEHNLKRSSNKHKVEVNNIEKTYSNYVHVDVKKSATNEAYFIVEKESRGKNINLANKNAKRIEYNYSKEGNRILFNTFFLSDIKNIWKDEQINITVFVPENNYVFFDNSAKNFLYDVDNTENILDRKMANHYFIMTESVLKCTDCVENDIQ
ncbi:PspC domain-containing protein [uncultured Polaribacter sp.]|uniref:PspC domain-containing protein n=1 Tax=uncultured Polaribacter sp. TaxID=174711 RepID=UPI002632BF7E|nr:PspC domain-containing protein [uncultured Polaribacter sp.]